MRKWRLTFTGLLLAGIFLPNAAMASGDDLLLQSTEPRARHDSLRGGGLQGGFSAGTPSAVFMQTGNGCGSCSDRFCLGSAIGSACAKGLFYTCQNALGLTCRTEPNLWQCACWNPNTPFP